jgi:hypothetical protein
MTLPVAPCTAATIVSPRQRNEVGGSISMPRRSLLNGNANQLTNADAGRDSLSSGALMLFFAMIGLNETHGADSTKQRRSKGRARFLKLIVCRFETNRMPLPSIR